MRKDRLTACYHWMRKDSEHILHSADVQKILSIKDEESFGHGIFVYKDAHFGYFRPQPQHCSKLVKVNHPKVLESVILDIGIRLALCEATIRRWPIAHIKSLDATKRSIKAYRKSSVWGDIFYSFEKISRSRRVGGLQKFKMVISAWSENGDLIATIKAMGAAEISK